MAFTAKDVFTYAGTVLQDEDHVRWPLTELLGYLNDGVRSIVSVKPNANSKTVTLSLAAGTLQDLPAAYTILSRITRNMVTGHTETGGPVGGKAIRPIMGRALMDSYFPTWQSDASLRGAVVQHVAYDQADTRKFYVVPANDGTGKVEAVVGVMPDAIPVPGVPDSIDAYSASVGLPDKFRTPLTDFVLARAFGKDSGVPGAAARAQGHMSLFTEAMAAISAAEQGAGMAASGSGA